MLPASTAIQAPPDVVGAFGASRPLVSPVVNASVHSQRTQREARPATDDLAQMLAATLGLQEHGGLFTIVGLDGHWTTLVGGNSPAFDVHYADRPAKPKALLYSCT